MTIIRKILVYGILAIVLATSAYIAALYYATFSDGTRSGELIKFNPLGVIKLFDF